MIQQKIDQLVTTLDLLPHPEGGFYKEVYRSNNIISKESLSSNFKGDRSYCTSIYFLLTSENFSAFHRIQQDEIWNFYEGSPLLVHVIDKDGKYTCHEIGMDPEKNLFPQLVVPAGAWFASSVKHENDYAFVGCTVAPGFDFEDFELANRQALIQEHPEHQDIITQLTRV
ncbi:MAG: cupin domain-containing protein [Flavobacteriales bacterium]|jgi:predicted cupin superfamily sugar epimerase|nr:cupin domain-containing protein [Flavobacteriales bacterium]